MLKKNRLPLLLMIFVLVIGLLGIYLGEKFVISIPGQESNDVVTTVLTGYWGAFFAFVFLGFSSIIQKIIKREVKHYNSLVRLETQLNEMIGEIRDNLIVLRGFQTITESGNIFWGNINPIILDKSHYSDLYDIELLNKVFSLYYQLRRLNDDMRSLMRGYEEVKNAYIQKQIRVSNYILNAKQIAEQVLIIEKFVVNLEIEVIELLSLVRILMRKDKPLTSKIIEFCISASSKNISIDELVNEKKKLYSELSDVQSESRRENDLILNK